MRGAGPSDHESWWAAFWYDWRRLSTYMMVVAVVALSFKVHRVYVRNDRDPWVLHPRYFARWAAPPRPLHPGRLVPLIRRPEPRKGYTA
jgi:hypothetical protein